MNHLPYLIWGACCLIATVGCILVFRSEDRATIADLRRTVYALTCSLKEEHELTLELRSRLSQLQPVKDLDAIIDRATLRNQEAQREAEALERLKRKLATEYADPYDQTKDRGPTRLVPMRWQ